MTGGIFVNYRRDPNAFAAQLISDRLRQTFGHKSVFLDVDGIRAGRDFVEVLDKQLADCDALLVIIGRDWAALKVGQGRRRLDAPNDFVRIEIEHALARGAFVLPVLVDDAAMPAPDDLPASIRQIATVENVEIRNKHLDYHVEYLVKVLAEALEERAKARLNVAESERIETERRLHEIERAGPLDAAGLAEESRRRAAADAARRAEETLVREVAEAARVAAKERQQLQAAEAVRRLDPSDRESGGASSRGPAARVRNVLAHTFKSGDRRPARCLLAADKAMAREWYAKGAAAGDSKAKQNLGKLRPRAKQRVSGAL